MRKKIDNRIRVLIENGVSNKHRTMFVVVGDKGRDQVVILHHMLCKAAVRARPSVLWCYKKELGFSSHRKKRMRQLQKKIQTGKLDLHEDDPFEMFIAATNIRYCYYAETHKILGNTFGMCVLQDYEALSPNLLARTIETVEGGGLVVLLLRSMNSLRQLYTMSMDVHSRFRTESHQDVTARFNERFILSLASCETCLCIDDQLNILPLSSHTLSIQPVTPKSLDSPLTETEQELLDLKRSLQDTQPVGVLVNTCRTLDQAKALLKFIEAISEKTLRSTVAMTAARGRGKSAALGLAMASAVAFGYSNIFVTAPSPENLKTMFEFVFKGFDSLDYEEHTDYELVQSTNPEFNKAIVRVNIFKEHRQTIQFIHPTDAVKLGQAELLCIDEAAAIPLPLVRDLLGPYLVFLSSTVNGYEGTGRSLSLKLIQQLREQSSTFGGGTSHVKALTSLDTNPSATGRQLSEIALSESIRYAVGDPVEKWLTSLLCLDVNAPPLPMSGCPLPATCDLYYVNRDTLFSYHSASESFLQSLMALYVASHYKNTPNDLQMLSDAPAHHLFCLLGPVKSDTSTLPPVLCVLQVCLEGEISKQSILSSLSRGKGASGDLIPWTVTQQFQDSDFGRLSGGRVVRIATHPDYQGMGYGGRALWLLQQYYQGRIVSLNETEPPTQEAPPVTTEELGLLSETLTPRKNLPPLLLKLSERPAEKLDYLGVSYGLTAPLLKFWKKAGYVPVYLRQTANDLTGEHSCIMLKTLQGEEPGDEDTPPVSWLTEYFTDFRRRFLSLLSYQFRTFKAVLALTILQQKSHPDMHVGLTTQELHRQLTQFDLKRLSLYSQNMADYHLIMDLLPALARIYFLHPALLQLSAVQAAVLLGLGLQHKSVDDLGRELSLPASQILGLFNRAMRKFTQCFSEIEEREVGEQMVRPRDIVMEPMAQSIHEELAEAAAEVTEKQARSQAILKGADLTQFKIEGGEDAWEAALAGGGVKPIVSVKGNPEKRKKIEEKKEEKQQKSNKKSKKRKR